MKVVRICMMALLFISVGTMVQAQQSAFQGTWIGEVMEWVDRSAHRLEISGNNWSHFFNNEIQAAGTARFSAGRAELLLANGQTRWDLTLLAPGLIEQPPGWVGRYRFRLQQAQRTPTATSSPTNRATSSNPADHPEINRVMQQVAVRIVLGHDINQDGLIDCIDAALWFWYYFPDKSRVRIMRNTHPDRRMNHLFNAVQINGRWYNIEPQTGWLRRSCMWMPSIWGDRYVTRYSLDRTSYWQHRIVRTQF